MAPNTSTITVQDMIDWARVHNKLQPFVGLGGLANQPALRIANEVKLAIINQQTYNWEWNRARHTPFLTVDGYDEYPILGHDIGWLENGYMEWNDDTSTPKNKRKLEVQQDLLRAYHKEDPTHAALDIDDYGQRIVRLSPIPSTTEWLVYLTYQKDPSRITVLSGGENQDGTFYPIPDKMEHVISQFYLAFCFRLVDKNTYYGELAEAMRRLDLYRNTSSAEQSSTIMVPDVPLIR